MRNRRAEVDRFYEGLELLRSRFPERELRTCTAADGWPSQGVYFFFEPGELRESGRELRVVRVGTHAVMTGSTRSLWSRLSTHRGNVGGSNPGGGNHRASVFRKHIGQALIASGRYRGPATETWGKGSSASKEVRRAETDLERAVSEYIGAMALVCLPVAGVAGPTNERAWVESSAIALLSNCDRGAVDPPSPEWLGLSSAAEAVRKSGLWNVKHVKAEPEPTFVDRFRVLLSRLTA